MSGNIFGWKKFGRRVKLLRNNRYIILSTSCLEHDYESLTNIQQASLLYLKTALKLLYVSRNVGEISLYICILEEDFGYVVDRITNFIPFISDAIVPYFQYEPADYYVNTRRMIELADVWAVSVSPSVDVDRTGHYRIRKSLLKIIIAILELRLKYNILPPELVLLETALKTFPHALAFIFDVGDFQYDGIHYTVRHERASGALDAFNLDRRAVQEILQQAPVKGEMYLPKCFSKLMPFSVLRITLSDLDTWISVTSRLDHEMGPYDFANNGSYKCSTLVQGVVGHGNNQLYCNQFRSVSSKVAKCGFSEVADGGGFFIDFTDDFIGILD